MVFIKYTFYIEYLFAILILAFPRINLQYLVTNEMFSKISLSGWKIVPAIESIRRNNLRRIEDIIKDIDIDNSSASVVEVILGLVGKEEDKCVKHDHSKDTVCMSYYNSSECSKLA